VPTTHLVLMCVTCVLNLSAPARTVPKSATYIVQRQFRGSPWAEEEGVNDNR
jgi:hypothetical protein